MFVQHLIRDCIPVQKIRYDSLTQNKSASIKTCTVKDTYMEAVTGEVIGEKLRNISSDCSVAENKLHEKVSYFVVDQL